MKLGGWETTFFFGMPIFMFIYVSFREGIRYTQMYYTKQIWTLSKTIPFFESVIVLSLEVLRVSICSAFWTQDVTFSHYIQVY